MNTPTPRNAVVLVFDRLHRGFLGAYGNSWIQTPNFDRLAAEGFLFDRAVIDSPQPEWLYRSYWQGWHALAQQTEACRHQTALARQLAEAGYRTSLVADEAWLAEHPAAGGFERRELIAPPLGPDDNRLAASVEDTHLANFFAVASDELATVREPFLLWLHTGSLGQLWDAPLEFRDQYRDADDPRSADSVEVPDRWLPPDFDPDELLSMVHAYAGQVSLMDLFLGELLDRLAAHSKASNTLLAVAGARGFPLGEHQRVGPCDEALYSELTNVPLVVRLPDGLGASDRTQALVQPADLCATLLEWHGRPAIASQSPACGKTLLPVIERRVESIRDRACTVGAVTNSVAGERAIATAAWSMRLEMKASDASHRAQSGKHRSARGAAHGEEKVIELFAKPDDWFDANEVSNRCGEVAERMEQALEQFEQTSRGEEPSELPPLSAELVLGLE